MKTLLTNWRYWVIVAVMIPGLILAFGEPNGEMSVGQYIAALCLTKLAGASIIAVAVLMFKYWAGRGLITMSDNT